MTTLFNKFKKHPILIHFPYFWGGKRKFSKYWALSSRTSYGSLTPSHMFGKNYDPIPSKCQDKPMDGRTDGRTNPPATSEGRKSIYLHSYLPFITRKF